MENTIIYLLGFPGTGKYTIAKEICRQDLDFKLVDNHLIYNPVFSLIGKDGKTSLPENVWGNVRVIRAAVLDTMKTLSPANYSFVLTNDLHEDDPDDYKYYQDVRDVAEARNAKFIPVHLTCDVEEMERRIVGADRAKRFKQTDISAPRKYKELHEILKVDHPNFISLDVTKLPPQKAAETLLSHSQNVEGF